MRYLKKFEGFTGQSHIFFQAPDLIMKRIDSSEYDKKQCPNGRLFFNFLHGDTMVLYNDISESAAIIALSKKYSQEEYIRNMKFVEVDKDDADSPCPALYWFYLNKLGYDLIKKDILDIKGERTKETGKWITKYENICADKFAPKIIKAINNAKTVGDLIDFFTAFEPEFNEFFKYFLLPYDRFGL